MLIGCEVFCLLASWFSFPSLLDPTLTHQNTNSVFICSFLRQILALSGLRNCSRTFCWCTKATHCELEVPPWNANWHLCWTIGAIECPCWRSKQTVSFSHCLERALPFLLSFLASCSLLPTSDPSTPTVWMQLNAHHASLCTARGAQPSRGAEALIVNQLNALKHMGWTIMINFSCLWHWIWWCFHLFSSFLFTPSDFVF